MRREEDSEVDPNESSTRTRETKKPNSKSERSFLHLNLVVVMN
jgi:hypothetical protein